MEITETHKTEWLLRIIRRPVDHYIDKFAYLDDSTINLFFAIIAQGILDLSLPSHCECNKIFIRDAQQFFNTSVFEMYAKAIEINPDWVRYLLKKAYLLPGISSTK